MKTVRDIDIGQKFMLCRDGLRYKKIDLHKHYGAVCKQVILCGGDYVEKIQPTILNNQCHVFTRI